LDYRQQLFRKTKEIESSKKKRRITK